MKGLEIRMEDDVDYGPILRAYMNDEMLTGFVLTSTPNAERVLLRKVIEELYLENQHMLGRLKVANQLKSAVQEVITLVKQ